MRRLALARWSVLYFRVPRLFAATRLARGDGRDGLPLLQIATVNLPILYPRHSRLRRRALREVVDDRYDSGSNAGPSSSAS